MWLLLVHEFAAQIDNVTLELTNVELLALNVKQLLAVYKLIFIEGDWEHYSSSTWSVTRKKVELRRCVAFGTTNLLAWVLCLVESVVATHSFFFTVRVVIELFCDYSFAFSALVLHRLLLAWSDDRRRISRHDDSCVWLIGRQRSSIRFLFVWVQAFHRSEHRVLSG